MEASDPQLTGDKVMAAKDYLLHHPSVKGQKVSVIGFSMGAAWAIIAAAYDPAHIASVALFYGAGDADFSKVQAPIIGHFSDVDEWEPYDGIQSLEGRMKDAGLDVSFYTYPGLAHWFVEEDRPEFNSEAAALAWDRTLQFLKTNS
jgi:carboxymethylenebutenolidase